MKLSGQQRENLEKALIDAFPDKASLERMLSYRLDKNLNQVAGDGDLATVVFNLIKAANAEGWIKDLVDRASQYNPGNLLLKAIASELLADNLTTTPHNKNKEDAIAEYRLKVKEFAEDGEISYGESEILKDLQKKLKLTEEEVRTIRDEALEPFGRYRENLDKYRQVFTKWVDEQGYPLGEKAKADLKKLQEYYQLKDEDITLLENEAEQLESAPSNDLSNDRDLDEIPPEIVQSQQIDDISSDRNTDDLSSDRNVDYTQLRDFLKSGQWKEADKETLAVMLKVTGRDKEGWLSSESIKNFPCTDLRTIDQLWVKYSNGRFGFSVQKRIWESVGKDYEKFGDRIGWRKGWWMNKDWITYSEV